jgi:hypothetical protein
MPLAAHLICGHRHLLYFYPGEIYATSTSEKPGSKAKKNTQQYHQKAAKFHELAFKHHKEADTFYESGDDKAAAHHAQLAHGHAR